MYVCMYVCVCVCVYIYIYGVRDGASSQNVAGSIPDGVIGIFHWHYTSGRTVTLSL